MKKLLILFMCLVLMAGFSPPLKINATQLDIDSTNFEITQQSFSSVTEFKLLASDATAFSFFGHGVSIYGDTAVVSASGTNSAYVFTQNGAIWSQQAKLTAGDATDDDWFGYSVSIYRDTIVVGAPMNKSIFYDAGAVYVFIRNGTTWSQQAKLMASDIAGWDYFGTSVSLNGDTVVIGAYGKNGSTGAAYVFTRNGDTWSQQAKLTTNDAVTGDEFGIGVSVYNNTAVIGAYRMNSGPGAVYVFTRNGGTWSQQAKLTASDATAGDWFGFSVSIYGDYFAVGADKTFSGGSGAVYIFTRNGTTWSQQAKLTATDGIAGDSFGRSVSLCGEIAIVGAYTINNWQGAAYVFTRNGSTWSQQAKLTATDATDGDWFGGSVSIYGDTALVGASSKNGLVGAAYIYREAIPPTITSFTPNVQCIGFPVIITGTNLIGATAVTFGGSAAFSFIVNSDTQITAIPSGSGSSGQISVTTPGGTATSNLSITLLLCDGPCMGFPPAINLEPGWNLISVPWYVAGAGTAPNIFFASLGTNLNTVYAFDACSSTWTSWNKTTGGSLTIDDGKGYWVNVTTAAQVIFTGTPNSTNPLDPLPQYNVCTGWNLIGYKKGCNYLPVSVYLGGLNFVRAYSFDNGSWHQVGANEEMQPGLGYWVAFTAPGFIYP